jgi:hypothetical protein
MRTYRALGAGLGWFTILAQYWLSTSESGLLAGSVFYFGFFTLWGNTLVTLAFTAPLLPQGRLRFFNRRDVRAAIGVYIFVVAVIFYLLLRKLYHPTGLGWLVNLLLHYIMPPLYLLDWLLFVPKHELKFRQIPLWLIVPLAYAAYTLVHGAVTGYYPYPFLNAAQLGYDRVLLNIGGLTLLFVVVSAVFIAAGRLSGRKHG